MRALAGRNGGRLRRSPSLCSRSRSASGRSRAARPRRGCPIVARHAARADAEDATSSARPRRRPGRDPRPTGDRSRSPRSPRSARDLELLAAPFHGETVGVLKDRRAHSYTAALAVRVTSFGLLDRAEQETRQAGWGGVLAGLAREGSPVSRIQWVERTVPADGDEIGRYLGEAWARDAVPVDSLAMRSYLELTSTAPAVTTDHELFVCLQIDAEARLAADQAHRRQAGRGRGRMRRPAARARGTRRAPRPRQTCASSARFGPACSPSPIRVAFDPWSRPGPRAPRRGRPRPRRHRRGRRLAAGDRDVVGRLPHGRRASTPPTGSRAGRASTSAPPSSRPCSCTRRWCERSP